MKILITTILALTVVGCVVFYVPTPTHGPGRFVISERDLETLEPNKTTRADILLRFGDPMQRLEQDRFFIYTWELTHGYLAVGAPGSGEVVPIKKHHYVAFEFASDHRLTRLITIKPWLFQDPWKALEEWRADESANHKSK